MKSNFQRKTRQDPFSRSTKKRPGETLEKMLREQVEEFLFGFMALLLSLVSFIVLWLAPEQLWIVLPILILYGLYKVLKHFPNMVRLNKGLKAERRVGEYLQGLERQGALVLHDLDANGFNIDHVVFSRTGIYVIETKYISKTGNGPHELNYTNGEISIYGNTLKSNPIGQVIAASKSLEAILKAHSTSANIQPVVIIPGWFISGGPSDQSQAWVLNEKAFPKWMVTQQAHMKKEDVEKLYRLIRVSFESSTVS